LLQGAAGGCCTAGVALGGDARAALLQGAMHGRRCCRGWRSADVATGGGTGGAGSGMGGTYEQRLGHGRAARGGAGLWAMQSGGMAALGAMGTGGRNDLCRRLLCCATDFAKC
jgi:hypothetical protein